MTAKKINAVLGILISLLLLDHALSTSIMMLGKDLSKATPVPAFILMGLVLLHVAVTMIFVMSRHDAGSAKYGNLYVRMILQRLTAALMLAVLPLHVYSALCMKSGLPTETLFGISGTFFTLFAMIHTGLSLPNALLSLGLLSSEKKFQIASAVSGAVFGLLAVLGVIAGGVFVWG